MASSPSRWTSAPRPLMAATAGWSWPCGLGERGGLHGARAPAEAHQHAIRGAVRSMPPAPPSPSRRRTAVNLTARLTSVEHSRRKSDHRTDRWRPWIHQLAGQYGARNIATGAVADANWPPPAAARHYHLQGRGQPAQIATATVTSPQLWHRRCSVAVQYDECRTKPSLPHGCIVTSARIRQRHRR